MDPRKMEEAMKNLSAEERQALAERMDREMDEYMEQLESSGSRYMDGWSEDNWEKEMEEHPFFSTAIQEGKELPPLLKGIQELKYSADENTPEELAKNYKEDGNFNFKCKKYRFAIASYTEGLKCKCSDDLLNAQLLTNRAASQFRLKNFRSSLLDCRMALAKKSDHLKALLKGAECALELKRFDECVQICDKGILAHPEEAKLVNFRQIAIVKQKEIERNQRREAALQKKAKVEEAKLLAAIKARGINVVSQKGQSDLALDSLEPTHPAALRKRVHFSALDASSLVWPVLFLYPEHGETDFVEEFEENQCFADHLDVMFGKESPKAPWDVEEKYVPEQMNLFFEDILNQKLVSINRQSTLKTVLSDARYRLVGGTPGIIVTVKGSKFETDFLGKYK
ncbi:hypothetical protein TCAL_12599 [Tigriopus californicus]|uniref:Cns1/TTC4 wheel domain-containing protein n=1 Tax=Tigriopus californicus TaxID=6832 RepID=A0A553NF76_TIGCA|nr:tetratricopeptide repeat protein 4-like [Tigriopus californicus]TRY64096.1 hypothetical protein TCAL_12599 [Tigriopus californicus]|eukprot:TCALIF_12599-PA protein Name:"Similar to TTC4 Tetratricopeptide repeat protein 4 (Homo sapiens)" AED:0.01 eAED:0.01 QI:0/-1/0/1/-1/1/1/0/396